MQERTEIDKGLRELLDKHVDLLREVELYKRLFEGRLASLLEVDRQIVDAITPEITPEQPVIVYNIQEKYEQTKRNRPKELDQDFYYIVVALPPGRDKYGLPVHVSCSVTVLSREESLRRFLQELAEKRNAKTKDGDSDD